MINSLPENQISIRPLNPNLFVWVRYFTTMRVRALLLALLLLGPIPAMPNLLMSSVSAGQVNHFGNSGFPNSVNITFSAAGNDTSTNLTLGASAVASSTSFDVQGMPDVQGHRPLTIGIDVGDDGDLEWAFGGPGNGSFGYINEFSNGWSKTALNLSSGHNMTYSLRLPINATVSSASMNVSTLSEITLSGSDVRDTYIHKPNPTWGNATHANCNYGNSTINLVGKTEWANWHIYRSLYLFNLSQLPTVTVLDANLSFWIDDVVNNANSGQPVTVQHNYDLRPLLKDWEEGQDFNVLVQQAPGATWNKAIDNVTGTDYSWTTAGASSTSDRGGIVATITESPANLEQTWMDFNSQSLTNLVQSWVNGTVSNQGLLFIGDESTSKPDGSTLRIASSDNLTHSPRLVVVFEGSNDVTAGIDIGNDGNMQWNHSGNLSNGSVIPNFASTLNSFLANASPTFTDGWGNEFVDIPLNVTGNATLILDEIEILYDWKPTVTISPHGNLLSEVNQHLSTLTPDATGNVSIIINVSSGSPGVVELSNLIIDLGDRPPSIGSILLPTQTMVPNGQNHVIGLEVTSYQGITNLSWITITPQLQNVVNRPIFLHSLVNGSSWVNDPGSYVSNISGHWQTLNSDTGQIEWSIETSWAWPSEQDVVWLAQTGTVDGLHTDRMSSATTNHERRMEITSFHLWDESPPTEGGPEVFENEWVAGDDQLRVSGTVNFLNVSTKPLSGDVLIELENVTGNGTTDSNGAFSIYTNAPSGNRYGGFTISAEISGSLDSTPSGLASRIFRVDATLPGMMLHAPLGERVIPNNQQLFNVSIAETNESSGVADQTLQLHWWVENLHDDGDGIPEIDEYATRPLLRQGTSNYFHATFEDTSNSQGDMVSLYIGGGDNVGNLLNGGGPGFEDDLHHYMSLVPTPSSLSNVTLELSGSDVIVPAHPNWLNITLQDENWLEDIERISIDMGQGIELTWVAGEGFDSSNSEVVINDYTLTSQEEEIFLNLSFKVTPLFNPASPYGQLLIYVSDSSGNEVFIPGVSWQFNADIMLVEYTISLAQDSSNHPLENDSYVSLNERLQISARVRYSATNLAPPPESYEVLLEVPLDLPLSVISDENGYFSGEMNAYGSGLYRVTLEVLGGLGIVSPEPDAVRLVIDSDPPILVGSEPSFIPANSTTIVMQFDLQEIGAGLSADDVVVMCQVRRGLQSIGVQIEGLATLQISGEVSRYVADLSFPPLQASDFLDCWLDVADLARNNLTGVGSSPNWPLSLSIVETRPDMLADSLTLSPATATFGKNILVNVSVVNIGNHTGMPFVVSLETLIEHEGQLEGVEVGRQQIMFLEGENMVVASFTWIPDWVGNLELVVRVDSDGNISERNENNTNSWAVNVESAPKEGGFFSQTSFAICGLSILFLTGIGMLFALRFRKEDEESEEWDDYSDEDPPPSSIEGTIQPDGHEYVEWPVGSNEWWHREDSQHQWEPWLEDN